jgi:hypothetical protein
MYRRKYFCICEGQQEKMYLSHLSSLLNQSRQKTVTFECVVGNISKYKKSYKEYDYVGVFDYDFKEKEFLGNIEQCNKEDKIFQKSRKAEKKRFYHAYSNINFDLWLILHKEDFRKTHRTNDAYIADVKRIFNILSDSIKSKKDMKAILKAITLEDVKNAIIRAENIRKAKEDCDIIGNKEYIVYDNPDFSIHLFLKRVLQDSGDW